jgi:hypothetical protein
VHFTQQLHAVGPHHLLDAVQQRPHLGALQHGVVMAQICSKQIEGGVSMVDLQEQRTDSCTAHNSHQHLVTRYKFLRSCKGAELTESSRQGRSIKPRLCSGTPACPLQYDYQHLFRQQLVCNETGAYHHYNQAVPA